MRRPSFETILRLSSGRTAASEVQENSSEEGSSDEPRPHGLSAKPHGLAKPSSFASKGSLSNKSSKSALYALEEGDSDQGDAEGDGDSDDESDESLSGLDGELEQIDNMETVLGKEEVPTVVLKVESSGILC